MIWSSEKCGNPSEKLERTECSGCWAGGSSVSDLDKCNRRGEIASRCVAELWKPQVKSGRDSEPLCYQTVETPSEKLERTECSGCWAGGSSVSDLDKCNRRDEVASRCVTKLWKPQVKS
ncbi:hypothetical protein J6590_051993 [Homalodisca vitripennis]|nr:hypothetical protein J6590_051993 [Homalodisca vitripennis]